MISENFPKSGDTSVVVTVWVCCHMPIHNCLRWSNTIYVWHGCGMQFERFYSLNDSIVGSFPHWHHMISANSPKSGETSVVVTVWVCCHIPICWVWLTYSAIYSRIQHLSFVRTMIPNTISLLFSRSSYWKGYVWSIQEDHPSFSNRGSIHSIPTSVECLPRLSHGSTATVISTDIGKKK